MNENDTNIENSKSEIYIKSEISKIEQEKLDNSNEKNNKEKELLIYNLQSVSVVRLICHLSGKLEIFLMIIGIFTTLFSGCQYSIWVYIFGDSINEFTNVIDLDKLPENEYNKKLNEIEVSINKLIFYFLILAAFTFITNFLMVFLWSYTALRQIHKLKQRYFSLIINQEQSWFDENNTFEFSTKVQNQLEQIELGLGDKFSQVILMFTEILLGFTVGFATSWKLTLILCSSFPIIIVSVIISDYCAEKYLIKSKKLLEKAGGISEEILYNIKTVTSFCNFDYEINRYNQLIDDSFKLEKKRALIEGIAYGLLVCSSFSSVCFCYLYSRILIANKEINYSTGKPYNSGDIPKVILCLETAIYSISGLGPNIQIIKKACIASSDYFTLLNRKRKILVNDSGYIPVRDNFKGKIEFKNVKFMYPNDISKKVILDGLYLLIEPGQKIAIVGESGCGKSTIINLIEQFYDSYFGEILIDDIDIKKYNLEKLRDLIGYVQQEPVLFNSSIRDNIIFGRENKLEKFGDIDSMIKESFEDAYIKDFIENNKDKYEYIVGIKGNKLSGGQKQRIAIARAILMKPKILILDEATSSLDNKSEKEVQKALDNICKKNITTIVIAHRLSTIKNSDIIYSMKDGKIIEKGTHEELLEKNGYYAGLIKEQLDKDEINSIKEKNKECTVKEEKTIESGNDKNSFSNNISTNRVNIEESEIMQINNIINNDPINKKDKKPEIKIDRKKLWKLLSDHKCDLFLGTISGLLYGSLAPFVGVILGMTINALSLKDIEKMKSETFILSLSYIIFGFFGGIAIIIKIWKLQVLGAVISSKMKKKVIKKYLELDMGYFDIPSNSPGALLTKLSIDTSQLDSLILNILGGFLTVISTYLFSIILGLKYDWKITLILSLFAPISIYGIMKREDYQENGTEINKKAQIEAGSFLSECVINTKTIFSFNFNKKAKEIYSNILSSETNHYLKSSIFQGFWMGFGLCCYFISYALAFKFGIIFIKNKTSTFENLSKVISNIVNSYDGLSDILRNIGDTKKAKLSFASVFNTLDTKSKISPFESENIDKKNIDKLNGKIEFKNVYFSYPTKKDQIVLKNISFTINPGQKVGLVGLSGSGKSSIIQLIERFYDVNSGEILIDGINIKEYNLYELRKKIGLVSQEPSIFKRNIYENILYGKLDANNEEVIKAAKNANIDKLINYDNINNPLSGGEKQRVAIARAFIKDLSIFLLDEATSALDKETENEIQKNIIKFQKGKTCITVAHRLSTIIDSDIIFVMDSGELVEKGNHDELIKLRGIYYTTNKYSGK